MSCTLAETDLSLRDIVDMKPGDIIPLEIPDLVTLCAEDVPVFRGRYGVSRGNMAVKIKEQILFPGQKTQQTKEVAHER
jgi:flagellar motor switch protein FliM